VEFSVATRFGKIYLYSLIEDAPLRIYTTNINPIDEIKWDQTSSFMSCFSNTNIKIFLAFSSTPIYEMNEHKKHILCLKWALRIPEIIQENGNEHLYINETVQSVNIPLLVSGSEDTTIKIWDIRDGKCIEDLKQHTSAVTCIDFSHDNKYMCSGGEDRVINVYHMGKRRIIWTLKVGNSIDELGWSFDDNYIAVSFKRNLMVIDAKLIKD